MFPFAFDKKKGRNIWQLWDRGFDKESCDFICNELVTKTQQATIGVAGSDVNESIRSSRVQWLTDNEWLRNRLWDYIRMANDNAFDFHLHDIENIQYTEYHADDEGHYDWHIDTFWDADQKYDRKLSLTIQLSDNDEYEGGEFECEIESPHNRNRGSVVVFPSYIRHRVTPVTRGVRKSLVCWVNGPRWR